MPPFNMRIVELERMKMITICLMFVLILSTKIFIIYLLGGLLYDDI